MARTRVGELTLLYTTRERVTTEERFRCTLPSNSNTELDFDLRYNFNSGNSRRPPMLVLAADSQENMEGRGEVLQLQHTHPDPPPLEPRKKRKKTRRTCGDAGDG